MYNQNIFFLDYDGNVGFCEITGARLNRGVGGFMVGLMVKNYYYYALVDKKSNQSQIHNYNLIRNGWYTMVKIGGWVRMDRDILFREL